MVYLDFPDMEMDIDTQERALAVLGGDKFEELFRTQSYCKLSFDIVHVHGWRRLPVIVIKVIKRLPAGGYELDIQLNKPQPAPAARSETSTQY